MLYVDDIANVLGKSEKAVAKLIARKNLPFKIRTVGGLRCVDIFQVTQWLSSDSELSAEATQQPSIATAPELAPSGGSRKRTTRKPASPIGSKSVATGLMTSSILQMRHDYAAPMARFAFGLRDVDELVFMQEVLEKLCFTTDLLASSFVVTPRALAPNGATIRGEDTVVYFDTEVRASDFLFRRIGRARVGTSDGRKCKSGRTGHFSLDCGL